MNTKAMLREARKEIKECGAMERGMEVGFRVVSPDGELYSAGEECLILFEFDYTGNWDEGRGRGIQAVNGRNGGGDGTPRGS